jgi:hypothetical protein
MSNGAFSEYNLVNIAPHTSPESGNGSEIGSDWQTSLPSGGLMSGVQKKQLDQADYKPREPFDFARGRLRYLRRRRNRSYVLVSALIIVGVGIGIAAVLLAEWLPSLAR